MILRIFRSPSARSATLAALTGAALWSCSEAVEPDRDDPVARGEVRGAVRPADSEPTASSILVQLWQDGTVRKMVTSNPDGSFLFTLVALGEYTIEFSAPDYRTERSIIELRGSLLEIAPVSLTRIRGSIKGMLFNEQYKKFHIGNIVTDRFKDLIESDRYWEVMNYLASPAFNAQKMCGSLCLQHKVNEYLDAYQKELVVLRTPDGPPPQHLHFI